MTVRGAPANDQDVVLDVATELLATYGARRVSLSDLSDDGEGVTPEPVPLVR